MGTSETLAERREPALADGVTDSDIPTKSARKKCWAGDIYLASVADKEVVKEHAQ